MLERSPVHYNDLREYLALLDKAGLLKHIKVEVDLVHEIGAVCARSIDRRGPALWFENIRGYKGMSLVTDILSTMEQVAIAFGAPADAETIGELINAGKACPIPPRVIASGACQEEVHPENEVDLYEFPTPWWHELDGGQYIGTTAGVVTADPDTGYINLGMYRLMIKDKHTLTVTMKGSHPVGEAPGEGRGGRFGSQVHILKNESKGRPSPIAIAMGMDPILTYVAAQRLPSDEMKHAEYAVAGAWRGKPVELVRCRTNDLLVPARAEIILEGEVVLNERAPEGPHGESQGFYSSVDQAFVVKLKCITHRAHPVSFGLICRLREDYPKFLLSERVHATVKDLGKIKDVYLPEVSGGGLGLIAIVAARVGSLADVEEIVQAINSLPEEPHRKRPRWLIVVDDDCDIRNWEEVMWRVAMAVLPDQDVKIGPRTNAVIHEPMEYMYGKTSSVVVDATFRSKKKVVNGKEMKFPLVNKVSKELMSKVESRWKEYGLD